MSSREKRLLNKVKNIDEIDRDMLDLNAMEEILLERLARVQNLKVVLGETREEIQQALLNKSCFVTLERMQLYDGEEIDVYVMAFDDEYIMYYNGVVAKAKCHPLEEEYDPVVGYALCRARLIMKLLELKYI